VVLTGHGYWDPRPRAVLISMIRNVHGPFCNVCRGDKPQGRCGVKTKRRSALSARRFKKSFSPMGAWVRHVKKPAMTVGERTMANASACGLYAHGSRRQALAGKRRSKGPCGDASSE